MSIEHGDMVCHKSHPKKVWVAIQDEGEFLWECRRVTDGDSVVTASFWEDELLPVGVLGVLDTLLIVARDANEDPAFIAEVAELRERYAETLEVDEEPETEGEQ